MSRRNPPRNQVLDETIWEDYWSPVAAYQIQSDDVWLGEGEDDEWIELSDEIDFDDEDLEALADIDDRDDEVDVDGDLEVEVQRPRRRRP
jgi:hypothetical protein